MLICFVLPCDEIVTVLTVFVLTFRPDRWQANSKCTLIYTGVRVCVCADDEDFLSGCRDSDGDSERTQGQHECSYGFCIQMREQVNFVYL